MAGADVVVLVLFVAATLGLGYWLGRGSDQSADGYLVGGRELPWWALLGSIVATETSAVTFLSLPAKTYREGGDLQLLQLAAGFILGRLLVSWLLMPEFFRGRLFSAYEVLKVRCGQGAERTASLLFLLARNAGDGLRLFLAALALREMTDWPFVWSVAAVTLLTLVYTWFGGLRAVIWNDCLQLAVYLTGGVLALIIVVRAIPGGWIGLHALADESGRLRIFNGDLRAPLSLWSGLIGGAFLSLGTHGADQMMVQRYLAARSQRDARWAVSLSGLAVFAQFALFLFVGVALAAFYAAHPERAPAAAEAESVFARFIVQELPRGVSGIVLASVFAAAMSTLSSSLNSSATVVVKDLWPAWSGGKDAAPDRVVTLSRRLTVLFAAVQAAVAVVAWRAGEGTSVIDAVLAIAGLTFGVLLGGMLLALLDRRHGAVAGMMGGLGVMVGVYFGTTIAGAWYALLAITATTAIGWIADRLAKEN